MGYFLAIIGVNWTIFCSCCWLGLNHDDFGVVVLVIIVVVILNPFSFSFFCRGWIFSLLEEMRNIRNTTAPTTVLVVAIAIVIILIFFVGTLSLCIDNKRGKIGEDIER